MTETEQRRHIRGITVYNRITDDVAQRCLPLSSQPSNSAEFLLHTAAQRMSVTQQLIARHVYFNHTTTAPASQLIPGLHLIFGQRRHALGSLNSRRGSAQYYLSIFVIFLPIALKIRHKIFVLFRFSKI